jgi:hypothetical protein
MDERQDILNGLEPLFNQAERECLWFYSRYQDMWFSPNELREAHSKGRFIWGAPNWELRDPQEKIDSLERLKLITDVEISEMRKRINQE